jgi:4-amino-4-deoxy-L-arabinose transferase-like glycosyltransferase
MSILLSFVLITPPLLALGLLMLMARREAGDWRRGLAYGAVAWGVLLVLITELLSPLEELNQAGVFVLWLLAAVGVGVALQVRQRGTAVRQRHQRLGNEPTVPSAPPVTVIWREHPKASLLSSLPPIQSPVPVHVTQTSERAQPVSVSPQPVDEAPVPWLIYVGWIVVGLVLLSVAVLALVGAPNNFDAMTYRMARVAHWIQDQSVAFYPTANLRQLHTAPGAQFIILHLQLLWDSDRLANMVQWAALVGTVALAALLAAQLGANIQGQMLAGIFCCTLPMAILQASNTQNDLVCAFWLMAMTALGLEAIKNPLVEPPKQVRVALAARLKPLPWMAAAGSGAALGLAILTKGTAYLFALPIMVWLGVTVVRRFRKMGLALLGAAAVMALLINLGQYSRCQELFGSPLGPGHEQGDPGGPDHPYYNGHWGVRALVSNVLRNAASELTSLPSIIPGTHDAQLNSNAQFNSHLEGAVRMMHGWMGVDPDDTRTTWVGQTFGTIAQLGAFVHHEDIESSPIHLLLLYAVGVVLLVSGLRGETKVWLLGACATAGGLLFCAVLRWQPNNAQMHLPLFMLWAPAAAAVLSRGKIGPWLSYALCAGLLCVAAGPVIWGRSHPMLGELSIFTLDRRLQYFLNDPGLYDSNNYVAQRVQRGRAGPVAPPGADPAATPPDRPTLTKLGYITDNNTYEYPLWILLHDDDPRVQLEHIKVTNESQRYSKREPFASFKPELIITFKKSAHMMDLSIPKPRDESGGNGPSN